MVGIIAGLAASLLKSATSHIAEYLQQLEWQDKYYLFIFSPAIGILLSIFYVRRFIRKSKFEPGLAPVIQAVGLRKVRTSFHNIYSQIITSALTVGFGAPPGLESPIVASGAAIGSNTGYYLRLNRKEITLLLACGAAAGISAVFNSPIAGMIFAIEVLLPEFAIPAFVPLLLASATSAVVARIFYNEQLFFLVTEGWEFESLLLYIVMGILLGTLSYYFITVNLRIRHYFEGMRSWQKKFALGGLSLGALLFIFPSLYGEGYIVIKGLLSGDYQVAVSNSLFDTYVDMDGVIIMYSLLIALVKMPAAGIAIGSGGNGGLFGPSLVTGGMLGFVFAYALNITGLFDITVQNFVVAGMAGTLSGIIRAPLTAIFLIAEITGGYILMVPLMIVSAISFFISRYLEKFSIYTKELAEKGAPVVASDPDRNILGMMKLRYLIEKNFFVLDEETPLAKHRSKFIHSQRNIFPVVDEEGQLKGILMLEDVLSYLFEQDKQEVRVKDVLQPPPGTIDIHDSMETVMRKLEDKGIWMLPVTDQGRYIGFVSKSSIFGKYRALMLRQARQTI